METPLVSIIVPVYNVELYLDACLNSIKGQTYQKLEIIIVEDCSTDNSNKILESHLNDKRIRLIRHKKNSGLSAARNSGIMLATGQYMMFVDSDDIIDSYLVENCVNSVLETDADLITYGFTPFEDGIEDSELPYPDAYVRAPAFPIDNTNYLNFPHFAWLKFMKSSIVKSDDLKFPVGLYYEDWPFHWELGFVTKTKYEIPVNFYLYRQRQTSITGSTSKKLLDIFDIHALVIALVDNYKAYEVRSLLANKIKQSHWSILTQIDSDLLSIALKKAKKAHKEMKSNDYKENFSSRNFILNLILTTPNIASLTMLKALRIALKKRRQRYKQEL